MSLPSLLSRHVGKFHRLLFYCPYRHYRPTWRAVGTFKWVVPTWHTPGAQGSDYAYGITTIEEPCRATQLRNWARAHALSQGRNYLTLEDVHSAIKAYVIYRKNNNI